MVMIFKNLTQATTYEVGGIVKSGKGTVIEGVKVSIQGKSQYTDGNGTYNIIGVQPGQEIITCEAKGYETISETINVNKNITKNLILRKIPKLGNLTVKVLDKDSSSEMPIAEAEVKVKNGSSVVDTETTDIYGEVIFNLTVDQTYDFQVSKEGYIGQTMSYKVIESDTLYFELEPNEEQQKIPVVSVHVNNEETKQAIQGVSVKLTNKDTSETLTRITDSTGGCKFNNVELGDYTVNLSKEDYDSKTIEENLRLDYCDLNYSLKSNLINIVTIHAVDEVSQKSMSDVTVVLTKSDDKTVKYTDITDEDGNITFHNVKSGNYDVIATNELIDDFTGTCTFNEDSHYYEIQYKQTKIKTATVTVRDDTTKDVMPNVTVLLTQAGSTTPYTGTTDEKGVCTFEKLRIGTYTCKCSAENYPDSTSDIEFTVLNNNNNIYMSNVIDEVTVNVVNNISKEPLENIKVSLSKSGMETLTSMTNASGDAKFQNIIGGEYTISTESEDYEDYTESYIFSKSDNYREIQLVPVPVPEVLEKVTFIIFERSPWSERFVRLANIPLTLSHNDEVDYESLSDQQGYVLISNVVSGSYTLKAYDPTGQHSDVEQEVILNRESGVINIDMDVI